MPGPAGLVGEEGMSLVVAGAGAGRAAGLRGDADVNVYMRVVRAGRGDVWWGTGPWEAKRQCHHAPSSPHPLCVSTECLLWFLGGRDCVFFIQGSQSCYGSHLETGC